MKRRQLLLVALIGLAGMVAFWIDASRLKTEEQRLVGTWRYPGGAVIDSGITIVFRPDRSAIFTVHEFGSDRVSDAYWYIRDDKICFDEPDMIHRRWRALQQLFGVAVEVQEELDLRFFDFDGTATEEDPMWLHVTGAVP